MEPDSAAHEAEHGEDEEVPAVLDEAEAGEEIVTNDEDDHPMDSDDEGGGESDETMNREEVIQLANDSIAHFDSHRDSLFCITQHPKRPDIVATGGGDDTTYIWSSELASGPLPTSYETSTSGARGRESISVIAKLTGHTDSVNALTFAQPSGDALFTGGLDGQLRVYDTGALLSSSSTPSSFPLLASAQEVPEINFLLPCPKQHAGYSPTIIALGASDGSVWVYAFDPSEPQDNRLQVVQAYYLHTGPCTAGAWTPDGQLLATVSEDGSFYVWDVFGAAASAMSGSAGQQAIVSLTASDQRFEVEGGLYSVAIAPSGTLAAVGGAQGIIRVVGLPRLDDGASNSTTGHKGGEGSRAKAAGGKQTFNAQSSGQGQVGQILASLAAQSDSVETLTFSQLPLTLLAAGSVDGSIVLFDYAHNYAVRRHIKDAHEEYGVVKVAFGTPAHSQGHLLTSCGLDGEVRRWDVRGGTAAGAQGFVREWKGHRGEGEGGGVLGFVVDDANHRIVTAGDDSVALVFDTK